MMIMMLLKTKSYRYPFSLEDRECWHCSMFIRIIKMKMWQSQSRKWTISYLFKGRGFLASFNWERWLTVKVKEEPPVFFVQTGNLIFINGKGAKIHLSSSSWKRCKNLFKHNAEISPVSSYCNIWEICFHPNYRKTGINSSKLFFSILRKILPLNQKSIWHLSISKLDDCDYKYRYLLQENSFPTLEKAALSGRTSKQERGRRKVLFNP